MVDGKCPVILKGKAHYPINRLYIIAVLWIRIRIRAVSYLDPKTGTQTIIFV